MTAVGSVARVRISSPGCDCCVRRCFSDQGRVSPVQDLVECIKTIACLFSACQSPLQQQQALERFYEPQHIYASHLSTLRTATSRSKRVQDERLIVHVLACHQSRVRPARSHQLHFFTERGLWRMQGATNAGVKLTGRGACGAAMASNAAVAQKSEQREYSRDARTHMPCDHACAFSLSMQTCMFMPARPALS